MDHTSISFAVRSGRRTSIHIQNTHTSEPTCNADTCTQAPTHIRILLSEALLPFRMQVLSSWVVSACPQMCKSPHDVHAQKANYALLNMHLLMRAGIMLDGPGDSEDLSQSDTLSTPGRCVLLLKFSFMRRSPFWKEARHEHKQHLPTLPSLSRVCTFVCACACPSLRKENSQYMCIPLLCLYSSTERAARRRKRLLAKKTAVLRNQQHQATCVKFVFQWNTQQRAPNLSSLEKEEELAERT